MIRILALLFLACLLSACDAVSTITEGFKEAKAVETDLATTTGTKPQAGFNGHNGRRPSVTATAKLPSTSAGS